MNLSPSLIVALLCLFVVFIGVFLAVRASLGSGARPHRKPGQEDGSIVVLAGADSGSRKGHADSDGRDSGGNDGGSDGGGDGGGGGGD